MPDEPVGNKQFPNMKYQQRTIAHRLAMRRIAPVTVAGEQRL
jgi:hypothetical protein